MDSPDFDRLRRVLTRAGEPDRVPLGDISVHPILKARLLGRPVQSLADDVAFWAQAGFDHVPVEQGLQTTALIKQRSMEDVEASYGVDTGETQHRQWATEGKGLVTTQAEFDSLDWPNPDDFDYSRFAEVGRLLPPGAKVVAVLGKLFSCVWWLMGLEGLSMALADDPDLIPLMFEKVGRFQFRVFEEMLRYRCIGAFWHADDIAFATSLLVSPRILRAHLFHWYKEMNGLAHARGLPVIYHSDGALQEVMEDIIDCGFDGLNPIEPKAMAINEIKQQYGSRISILGNIDLGYTLTRGTPEEVREEVRQRIHDLAPGGGYAVASSNSIPEYVPLVNYNAMRQATFEFGRYPISV